MSKKTRKTTEPEDAPPTSPRMRVMPMVGLTVTSLAAALLSTVQWMQLLVAAEGGKPFCAVSEKMDCVSVWSSPFAKQIHSATGVPVAGWGLVWALVAFALSMLLWARASTSDERTEQAIHALKATALVGVVTSLGLGGVSTNLGVFCIMCIFTYLLTLAFAGFTALLPGPLMPPVADLVKGGLVAGALTVAGYLMVLYPGQLTPTGKETGLEGIKPTTPTQQTAQAPTPPSPHAPAPPTPPQQATPPAPAAAPQFPDDEVGGFLKQLPPNALQGLSDTLGIMRESTPKDTSRWPTRMTYGPASAPVKIVEFTDVRCGHCRQLSETMHEIQKLSPPGSFSVEARHFPLDSECNPEVKFTDGTGLRCLAAKALICVEKDPKFWDIHSKLFQEQESLSKQRVMEIVLEANTSRKALEECIASKKTDELLKQDIAYAMAYDLEGTPLVIINGRKASSIPPFLYAMILAKGDPNHPAFQKLPAPRKDAHVH
ncbi:MAG: thioredoxin domain-containing protein [Myxococcota bacterium]